MINISFYKKIEIKSITLDKTQVDDKVYNQYEININYNIYVSHDTYVRAQITFCHYIEGIPQYSYCFSNPIFIDFPPYGQ